MKRHRRAQSIALHALLTPAALLFLAPIWLMVVFATVPEAEIFRHPPALWFGDHFLENLRNLQADTNFGRVVFNSVAIATIYTAVSTLLCSMGGYAFAKFRFRGQTCPLLAHRGHPVHPHCTSPSSPSSS